MSSGAVGGGAFKPPGEFTFEAKDWPSWKKRFERFHTLSALGNEKDNVQIDALIYTMGDRGDEVLATLKFQKEDDKKVYKKVLEGFDSHYNGEKNVVYERAKFGMRTQQPGESVDSFVTSLHTLSEYCEYEDLRDSLIRDRIVLGVSDMKLRDSLMMDRKLTLTKAVDTSKHWEMVRNQQGDLQAEGNSKSVERIVTKPSQGKRNAGFNKFKKKEYSDQEGGCSYCGLQHEPRKCPAFGKECSKCKKMNHYASCCRSRRVEEIRQSGTDDRVASSEQSDFSMDNITRDVHYMTQSGREREERWRATINVDGMNVQFKLDPGADVTSVPYYDFRKCWKNRRIQPTDVKLLGPDATTLKVVGVVRSQLKWKEKQMTEDVYVVRGLKRPLLGLGACEDLGLVKRMNLLERLPSTAPSGVKPKEEFPELFTGLGKLEDAYEIKLKKGARPVAVCAPRRVPIPLMGKVKEKLDLLLKLGVIEAVDEPSEWCSPLVTQPKTNGDIRLCVDLTALNQNVEREYHPMPVVEYELGLLAGGKVFTKLDLNSGFHQIMLNPRSKKLTTFITPFGRFRYTRMPFGISSAPEHFQKRMAEILKDIPGVVNHIDDTLIQGKDIKDHDEKLRKVLGRLRAAGMTLNESKCEFGVSSVKFLGHIIDANGVRADPTKVEAILKMAPPCDVAGVKRFLGLANYLGRFIPNLSEISKPIYDLTKADVIFVWNANQQRAFDEIKTKLAEEPTLALFDPNKETTISCDASSFGLGALLLQKQEDGSWKPIAYASRMMTGAEQRYAQIEKEALGIVWGCERFRDFLLGMKFTIETDHKPLVPIMTTKGVDELSPRLQRFRIRMMWYSFNITYVPGKKLVCADALSRQPLEHDGNREFEKEVVEYVNGIVKNLPITDEKLAELWKAQKEDLELKQVMEHVHKGWPEDNKGMTTEMKKYFWVKDELSVTEGILLRNSRMVVPRKMRADVLGKIHAGHLGIGKCRARARISCWWPGQSEEIAECVRRCPVCVMEREDRKEPMIPSDFPTRPWQKLGMDLFHLEGKWFLLVVDYFSRFPEVAEVKNLTSKTIIDTLKKFFSRHGVPEELRSDNGTQFHPVKTSLFQAFAEEYGFIHQTSSPRYPQSNGFAENGVKVVKRLFKKNTDWLEALMEYRATPLANGYTPSELLMGRQIRTKLPIVAKKLVPANVPLSDLKEKEEKRRQRQKFDYDRRHGVVEKEEFTAGDLVWVKDLRTWGNVTGSGETPRSYMVKTPRGEFRRNSTHLTSSGEKPTDPAPDDEINTDCDKDQAPTTPMTIPRRSGRTVIRTRRLVEEI